MTTARKLFISALMAATSLASGLAMADYSAAAFASDGSGSWATKKTQAEANSAALKSCNEGISNMDCELRFTKAIALVVNPSDDDFAAYVPSLDSVEDAKARALKSCTKPGCRIEKVTTDPGFWAFAVSKNTQGARQTYLAHGYADFNEARADAVKRCEELAKFQCERKWSGVIAGEHPASTAPAQKHPSPSSK